MVHPKTGIPLRWDMPEVEAPMRWDNPKWSTLRYSRDALRGGTMIWKYA